MGHEKVPHGSGLTRDHGSDPVDGARTEGLPEPHGLLPLFLRYSTPDWAEGEGRTVCIFGYSKGL